MPANRPADTNESPIATLHPASFAIVMATGIVSIAAQLRQIPGVAMVLLWLNVFLYVALWILTLIRAVRHCDRFLADFLDHSRCVGFFTLVAATCVLGNQFVVVAHRPQIALVFWIAGTAFWAILTYSIFTILTVKSEKPSLGEGINGDLSSAACWRASSSPPVS